MTDTKTRTKIKRRARPKPEVKRRVKRREAEEPDDSLRKGVYFKLPPRLLRRLAWWARRGGVTKTYILEIGLRAELQRMKKREERQPIK